MKCIKCQSLLINSPFIKFGYCLDCGFCKCKLGLYGQQNATKEEYEEAIEACLLIMEYRDAERNDRV